MALQPNSAAIGRINEPAVLFGRAPIRAMVASGIPGIAPTHQVALMPQTKPGIVGPSVGMTRGCPIVKYSTQILAVIWSWTTPKVMQARIERTIIARNCISVDCETERNGSVGRVC